MEKKNPGEFRASCLYLLAGIGLWAVGLAVQLLSAPLSRMITFALMLLVSVACYFPFVLFPTIAAVWNTPDALRLNPLPVGNALRVCVLALLTVITAQNGTYLWLAILQKLGLNVFAVGTPVPTTRSELYLCLASAAILAPICQELLFRGAMLSAWEARGGRRAVWITTILFAMLHGSTEGLPAQLLAGVLLALVVLYTDSLYAGLIFHTVYNAGVTLLSYYESAQPVDAAQQALVQMDIFAALGGAAGVASILIDLAIFGGIIWILMRRMRRSTELKAFLAAHEGGEMPKMEYREMLNAMKAYSPLRPATETAPLRTSTILVLLAGIATAVVRYIADIISML